jgi:hypothetical protein
LQLIIQIWFFVKLLTHDKNIKRHIRLVVHLYIIEIRIFIRILRINLIDMLRRNHIQRRTLEFYLTWTGQSMTVWSLLWLFIFYYYFRATSIWRYVTWIKLILGFYSSPIYIPTPCTYLRSSIFIRIKHTHVRRTLHRLWGLTNLVSSYKSWYISWTLWGVDRSRQHVGTIDSFSVAVPESRFNI